MNRFMICCMKAGSGMEWPLKLPTRQSGFDLISKGRSSDQVKTKRYLQRPVDGYLVLAEYNTLSAYAEARTQRLWKKNMCSFFEEGKQEYVF
jgi:hypothetical protein